MVSGRRGQGTDGSTSFAAQPELGLLGRVFNSVLASQ